MYTKEQASQVRQQFWTGFGKYMHPVLSADGQRINWINYKTGIRHLFFRMNAGKKGASLFIEIMHKDPVHAQKIYQQFILLKPFLKECTNEDWIWEQDILNDNQQPISSIGIKLSGCNVLNQNDWPAIISFLKPRIIALDAFWCAYKMLFEMID